MPGLLPKSRITVWEKIRKDSLEITVYNNNIFDTNVTVKYP